MNLDATVWNDIQLDYASNDKRFSPLGVIDLVKDSGKAIDWLRPSDREKLQSVSSLQNVRIPVIEDQTVTVLTTPGFNYIPSNLETSANYYFQPYDVFTGMRHFPAAYDNNQIDERYAMEQKMKNIAYEAGKVIEANLVTNLEARKSQQLGFTTQVSQGDGTYSFSTGTDTLTVSKAAQKDGMFFYLESLMNANDLPGNYRLVTSRGGTATLRAEYLKYGAGNEKNLQGLFQLPMDRLYETSAISPGSDVFSGFLVRDGAIGMVENYPYDFRNGTKIGGREWSISNTELPFARLRANIYVNNEPTEATSLFSVGTDSNLIMTHVKEMAIWFRFYVLYRYNGNLAGRPNDIVKVVGATS